MIQCLKAFLFQLANTLTSLSLAPFETSLSPPPHVSHQNCSSGIRHPSGLLYALGMPSDVSRIYQIPFFLGKRQKSEIIKKYIWKVSFPEPRRIFGLPRLLGVPCHPLVHQRKPTNHKRLRKRLNQSASRCRKMKDEHDAKFDELNKRQKMTY